MGQVEVPQLGALGEDVLVEVGDFVVLQAQPAQLLATLQRE
jgi:hypothetical protein